MTSSLNLASSVIRVCTMVAAGACLAWAPGAQATSSNDLVLSSRIDRVIVSDDERKALGGHVQCRDAETPGPWVLVSRSWGGSPNLRHHRLVAAPQAPLAVGDRMAVRWGACTQGN